MAKLKHKLVFQKAVENGGNITQAARDVGYSEATLNSPKNITATKSWQELLDQYIPDDLLTQKLEEGLEANKQLAAQVIFKKDAPTSQSARELPAAGSTTNDFIEVPDMAVRHKYLETAFKVKGKLVERKDITSDGEALAGIEVLIIEDKTMAEE